MTVFWIIAVVIMAIGLVLLAPALLRPKGDEDVDLNARNVAIAKERLAELEAEKTSGALTEQELEQAKAELEGNLIDDLRDDNGEGGFDVSPSKATLIAVLLFVPLFTGALYYKMGVPDLAGLTVAESNQQPEKTSPHGKGQSKLSMDEMLAVLEKKLKKDPNNVEGWFVLGRSYMSQRNYAKAAWALEEALKLANDHPTILVGLADALAMKGGGRITGRSENLLRKALKIEPENTTALWLMGIAMEEQSKYKEAVGYWQRALELSRDNPETASKLRSLIAEVQKKGGFSDTDVAAPAKSQEASPAAEITVSVALDESLQQQVSPDDILFVLAKATSGPPMPLAAAKLKVADLPATVTLNDAMAMMPQMKLSKFSKVNVQARIAKSGKPMAQSGDLESELVEAETTGTGSVKLVINRQVP